MSTKVIDNELCPLWSQGTETNDIQLYTATEKLLLTTKVHQLRNAEIVAMRKLLSDEFVILVQKSFTDEPSIYSLFVCRVSLVNRSVDVVKYCTISNDVIEVNYTILKHKVLEMVDVINEAIDKKFNALLSNYFYTVQVPINKDHMASLLASKNSNIKAPSLFEYVNSLSKHEYNQTKRSYPDFKKPQFEKIQEKDLPKIIDFPESTIVSNTNSDVEIINPKDIFEVLNRTEETFDNSESFARISIEEAFDTEIAQDSVTITQRNQGTRTVDFDL